MRFARSSWIKRTRPLISSIPRMMAGVVMLRLKLEASTTSVTNEMIASANKTTVNGLINALLSR